MNRSIKIVVQITKENREYLKKWVESRPDFNTSFLRKANHLSVGYWVTNYPRFDHSYQYWAEVPYQCKQVTLEEFKQSIENNKNTMEKKIIGYKAPYDLFEGKVAAGTVLYPT